MLESVVSSVVKALKGAGLEAVGAYPEKAVCGCAGTVVCVGIKSAKGLPAGFGGYLGTETDPVTGLRRELYGARCELEVSLDIYAGRGAERGPAECMRYARLIPAALAALPEGLRASALEFSQPGPDRDTGLFLCRGVLRASAHFTARAGQEDGEFTDFILRGSIRA